tara:strand:+ start:1859 stop:3592 length:1734 start_codon:yes stop_codon:yes gene_type:complete
MLYLTFSYQQSFRHFLDIELKFTAKKNRELIVQLPSWRPGRYELADFSQNIQKFDVVDSNGNKLDFHKTTKDRWSINTNWDDVDGQTKEIKIQYNYYANKLDAGSTYLDEKQLYINPVNCCLYIIGREQEEYQIEFKVPQDYKLASGLKEISKNQLTAESFDQLVESPIIASPTLREYKYQVNDIPFHIWIQGESEVDEHKMCQDFKDFTVEQIKRFGSFPVKDYHFLFQLTPYDSYHGVEHTNSTVILLGNKGQVLKERYEALLGICSHELYHTWNIKSIRPIEMQPYDYSKENYTKLGYVAEGVTTYMGDLMLKRSKVFSWDQFFDKMNQNIKRHYENDGRFNMSVAESGFDSWLDGYSLGIPNRKTNIYTEGALNMLMLDLTITNHTERKHSLHCVMKDLYQDWGLKNKGFNENDFIELCVKYGGEQANQIIKDHIYNKIDYTKSLETCLSYVGLELEETLNPSLSARYFGFICIEENNKIIVKKIQDNSIIEQRGIAVEDELLEVDNQKVTSKNLNELLKDKKQVSLKFKNRFSNIELNLNTNSTFFNYYKIAKQSNPSTQQIQNLNFWLNEK